MTRIRNILASTRGRIATTVTAAFILLVVGGMTSASAAGQITSGGIANQTIQSWDVAEQGIGKSELRTNSVGQIEIREDAVGTGEIKDGNVTENDLSQSVKDQLGQGPQGVPGEDGADGKDGVSGYEVVIKGGTIPGPGGQLPVVASCPEGKIATGGGYLKDGAGWSQADVTESAPATARKPDGTLIATGWEVVVVNQSSEEVFVQATALCVNAA